MKSKIIPYIFIGFALLLITACSRFQGEKSIPSTPAGAPQFGPTEAWATIAAITTAYPDSPTEQSIKMTEAMSTTQAQLVPISTPIISANTEAVATPIPSPVSPTLAPIPAELLASDRLYPHSLIVDSKMVFWASCDTWESDHGVILAYSKDKKEITTLASGIACPIFPQADQLSLYWMDREQIEAGGHNIVSLSKDGGKQKVLFSSENMERLIAVDQKYVYWNTRDGLIMRISKAGGGAPEQTALEGGNRTLIDGPDVYWFNTVGDLLYSQKDAGSTMTLVKASDFASTKVGERLIQRGLGQVLPGSVDVYFTASVDGNVGMVSCTDNHAKLMKISKNGGEYKQLADIAGSPDILISEPYAYFGGSCHSGIQRLNLNTQNIENFADNTGPVDYLTDDDRYVYWVELDNGSIKRAPKPEKPVSENSGWMVAGLAGGVLAAGLVVFFIIVYFSSKKNK